MVPNRIAAALPTAIDITIEQTSSESRNRLGFSVSQAMDEVIAERKRVEEYTQEQYGRLSRLRELIRSERTAAEQEHQERLRDLARLADDNAVHEEIGKLRKSVEISTMERDAALKQLLTLRREATTSTPREDFSILPCECAQELEQIRGERDQALKQLARLAAEIKAERAEATLQAEKLEEEMAWQERELVAERRLLQEERRRVDEEAREVFLREKKGEPARYLVGQPPANRELCLLDAELREMKQILNEQIERGWAELQQERLRLAKLREGLRVEEGQ